MAFLVYFFSHFCLINAPHRLLLGFARLMVGAELFLFLLDGFHPVVGLHHSKKGTAE
jgi:hypothetical protein